MGFSMKEFARVTWDAEDVKCVREDWTTEQAEDFLAEFESKIQDRMVEAGWDAIETLIMIYEFEKKEKEGK